MGTQESQEQTGTAKESPQPPGFIEGDGSSHFEPEGSSERTEDSGYAGGRI